MSEEQRDADSVLREEDLPAEHKGPEAEEAERTTSDTVDEADRESFPASDSPAWNSGGDPVITRERGKARR